MFALLRASSTSVDIFEVLCPNMRFSKLLPLCSDSTSMVTSDSYMGVTYCRYPIAAPITRIKVIMIQWSRTFRIWRSSLMLIPSCMSSSGICCVMFMVSTRISPLWFRSIRECDYVGYNAENGGYESNDGNGRGEIHTVHSLEGVKLGSHHCLRGHYGMLCQFSARLVYYSECTISILRRVEPSCKIDIIGCSLVRNIGKGSRSEHTTGHIHEELIERNHESITLLQLHLRCRLGTSHEDCLHIDRNKLVVSQKVRLSKVAHSTESVGDVLHELENRLSRKELVIDSSR